MALMMVVHTLVLLCTARRVHDAVRENIRYGLEKDELSESLRHEIELRARDAETIRRSEEELRTILNNMQDVFFREDLEGNLIRLSPSVTSLLGYRPEELLGRKTEELYVDPSIRKDIAVELKQNGGAVFGYRKALKHKNGDMVWVSTNAHYCKTRQETSSGWKARPGTSPTISDWKTKCGVWPISTASPACPTAACSTTASGSRWRRPSATANGAR